MNVASPPQSGDACGLGAAPSPSHGFAAGPSLSPRRGNFKAAATFPLLGEREGPVAVRRWEGEGACAGSSPRTAAQPEKRR
jgi:hypothetical protein